MTFPRTSILGVVLFALLAGVWIGLRANGLIEFQQHIAIPEYLDYLLIAAAAALFTVILVLDARRLNRAHASKRQAEDLLRRQHGYVNALAHTASQLSARRQPTEVLHAICGEAAIALGADGATIAIHDRARGQLRPAAYFGVSGNLLQPVACSDADLLALLPERPITMRVDAPGPCVNLHAGAGLLDEHGVLVQLPLTGPDGPLGVFSLLIHDGPFELSPEQAALFRAFAAQAGLAVSAERLMSDSRTSRSKLKSLRAGDMAILSSLDVRTTLNVFIQMVMEHLRVDAADVLLLDPTSQMLEYAAGAGFQTGALETSRVAVGTGFAGKVAFEQRSLYVADVNAAQPFTRRQLMLGEGVVTYTATPLMAKGKTLGVLETFHRRPFSPPADWLSFLSTLAGQASIAIDNAALFTNLQRASVQLELAYDRTLEGWSRALDLRDRETEGHTQRVTDLCLRLARELHVPQESLVHMRRGSLLHDIGKMGMSDQLLFKAGEYDDEDRRVMQRHPVLAYEMLAPIAFLQPALDIPYGHHERWDGSGYPRGLRGESIPLAARIFAVVDVWDAITSNRPYRNAVSNAEALQFLRDQAGRQFDPRVVDAFARLIPEIASTSPTPRLT